MVLQIVKTTSTIAPSLQSKHFNKLYNHNPFAVSSNIINSWVSKWTHINPLNCKKANLGQSNTICATLLENPIIWGCQIRRESAHGESVCCNNVRALFDELPTPHLIVEIIPFPAGPLTEKDYAKAEKIEKVLRSSPSV